MNLYGFERICLIFESSNSQHYLYTMVIPQIQPHKCTYCSISAYVAALGAGTQSSHKLELESNLVGFREGF